MVSTSPATVHGGGGRSGGKILKRRPIPAKKTPYDRPTDPPLKPEKENPNWVNVLVFPAKFVAGGAGKLFSSVWNPKSWGACSSSSSESDCDSGGIEDDHEHDENLHDDGVKLNKNICSSSGKSEILYLVEQLLMLERFSREECDRLIKIINLQIEEVDAGPNNPNISNKVIREARKMITDLDSSNHGSKSLVTPNRDYHGSWNIQNELQRLHSKALELMKPSLPFSLQALKLGNETVNMASKDMKTTQDDVPTEAYSSLLTIKKKKQIAEEKDFKDDKAGDDVNRVEGNSDMVTEYAEVADVIHASQGSSNTIDLTSTNESDSPIVKQAATRTRKYNTRRGSRSRGK